ncbi:MAG: T9SS type A sorting domain-containing protein [Ignavibacteria bacterium]
MKIFLTIVSLFLTLNTAAISQSGWFQQNPGTANSFNVVYFINENTGFADGGMSILKTTNGGNSWQQKVLPDTSSILAIRFLNAATGYACGGRYINPYVSRQYLFRTTDGGESWSRLYESSGLMCDVSFTDVFPVGNRIYLAAGGSGSMSSAGWMFVSSNAGANFYSTTFLSDTRHDKLSFINEMTGYVSTTYGTDVPYMKRHIFKTTDGGANWSMAFRDSSILTVFAQGNHNMMFKDANTGFALYNRGLYTKFARTTNGGVSWDTSAMPYNKYLSLYFADANTGWVSGNYYPDSVMILKTTNGGANWQIQKKGNANLYSLYFVNNHTGWAVGTAWFSGQIGRVYKTVTGGEENEALDYFPMSVGNMYVYHTPSMYPPYYDRQKFTIVKDSVMNGKRFYYFSNPLPGMWNYGNWYRVDTQTGLLTGYAAGYTCNNLSNERRTDSLFSRKGDTLWKCDGPFRSICKDTANLSVFGYSSKQKTFSEDGLILIERTLSKYFGITSVYTWEISGFTTYLVGCRINGFTYGDTLLTGVESVSTETPASYSLEQNYPNPFNSRTIVRFSLPAASNVSLKVYDVMGREVETLVNKRLQPGTYQADWNASAYSSGIYFYKLSAEEFSETKRMILLK